MNEEKRGWIEAAARLTRVLLRSPRVKAALRSALRHLDPANAEALCEALCETDVEVPLALVSALPELANLGIGILHALVRRLGRLPAPLVAEVAADLARRLELATLLGAIDGVLGVLDELLADPARVRELERFAEELGRTLARHPQTTATLAKLWRALQAPGLEVAR